MSHSTLLFTTPSFWEGFARSLDAGGVMTEFNSSLTPQQADELAIGSDWSAVGADLWEALLAAQTHLPRAAVEPKQEAATAE